jgi:metal-responsive CopG/Arc/MetJ family transcriptional regulator
MKAVQVLFDEETLTELDRTKDVRDKGRSAVLRELTDEFLRHQRTRQIDAQYEQAYAGIEDPLGAEFEGWEEEGVWPPD